MKAPSWVHSLKSRIVLSYSLILIVGGVSTSLIGIHVTGRALLRQGGEQVSCGLSVARRVYDHYQEELRQRVELLASSGRLQAAVTAQEFAGVVDYLRGLQQDHHLDFLTLLNASGQVLVRVTGPAGDMVAGLGPIDRALRGESSSGTEIIPRELLALEAPNFARQVVLPASPAPDGVSPQAAPDTTQARLAILAAAPVADRGGRLLAVVYAGRLLEGDADTAKVASWMAARIDQALSHGHPNHTGHAQAVTIFRDDLRVSTNLTATDGHSAVGTRVAPEVGEAVLARGHVWIGRSRLFGQRFLTAYEPITNLAGRRIGMLAVGFPEGPYAAVRNDVTLSFAAIALLCFVLIVVVTYFLTRSLTRPLEEMVSVSHRITAGDWDQRVHLTDRSELGLLSSAFNDMLDRIGQMKKELEQWGKTLEHKVEERSQQLMEVQTQAARQQRLASVGQLAAGVAHEINNPLGGIMTFASLVLEDLRPDDPHREELEEVVRQAVRCRKIVTGLLEFSRRRDAQMGPANINEVIFRTLALLETQAIFHDVNVRRRFDPDMPTTIMDESQMQQVVMNLILNAVDAMEGHGDLTIETRHSKLKKEIFVRIADTGCGIPEEIREAIFDPFFTTKDPGKGTGLGLSVACRIVQEHGGRTELESEVGKGTAFTIYLPMEPKTAPDGEMEAAAKT